MRNCLFFSSQREISSGGFWSDPSLLLPIPPHCHSSNCSTTASLTKTFSHFFENGKNCSGCCFFFARLCATIFLSLTFDTFLFFFSQLFVFLFPGKKGEISFWEFKTCDSAASLATGKKSLEFFLAPVVFPHFSFAKLSDASPKRIIKIDRRKGGGQGCRQSPTPPQKEKIFICFYLGKTVGRAGRKREKGTEEWSNRQGGGTRNTTRGHKRGKWVLSALPENRGADKRDWRLRLMRLE